MATKQVTARKSSIGGEAAFLVYRVVEVVRDAVFRFRSISGPRKRAEDRAAVVERRRGAPVDEALAPPAQATTGVLSDGEAASATLAFLPLALSRHDLGLSMRETSRQRAYHLLTFNLAVSALVPAVGRLVDAYHGISTMILMVGLFASGLKSALHCLVAASPMGLADLTVATLRDRACESLRHAQAPATAAIQILNELERVQELNDKERAIGAEHSLLATHTSMVQVVLATMFLLVSFLGGPWSVGPVSGEPPKAAVAQSSERLMAGVEAEAGSQRGPLSPDSSVGETTPEPTAIPATGSSEALASPKSIQVARTGVGSPSRQKPDD